MIRQTVTLARRHFRVIIANRGYLALLIALPFVIGLLPLAVAGDTGLRGSVGSELGGFQTKQILGLMNLCAIFTGTALSVRELVGERAIFHHEQAAGLSTTAYLIAKIVVLGGIGVLQSAILVAIVTGVRGSPPGASALGSSTLELFAAIAATTVTAMSLGLLVSTLARTGNQVFPLTVATLMVQIVFAGGMVTMAGRAIDPLSWLSPSRWGLAATASTADLNVIVPRIPHDDLWQHTAATWLLDMTMLVVIAALCAGVTRWRIRLRTRNR